MIVESKYNAYDTANKLRELTCTEEEYRHIKKEDWDYWPPYWGIVNNDKFELFGSSTRGREGGGPHLMIKGKIYCKNDKTYIAFRVFPSMQLIVILFGVILAIVFRKNIYALLCFLGVMTVACIIEIITINIKYKAFENFMCERFRK